MHPMFDVTYSSTQNVHRFNSNLCSSNYTSNSALPCLLAGLWGREGREGWKGKGVEEKWEGKGKERGGRKWEGDKGKEKGKEGKGQERKRRGRGREEICAVVIFPLGKKHAYM